MTNEERENAIKVIRNFDLNNSKVNSLLFSAEEITNAFDMAIKALEQEPCDDAISREDAINAFDEHPYNTLSYASARNIIRELPSVTQKSGKWDRLYSWLNDMRLGIAPDETVDDIDERHCRESQTDILDEIMEWMIKTESEDKE